MLTLRARSRFGPKFSIVVASSRALSHQPRRGPLSGVRVVELAGLAPAPFAGMVLADFGADVVRVDRKEGQWVEDVLARGKRSIALDMKHHNGRDTLLRLFDAADVVIEPFRPGVMEKLGFGPDVLCGRNPKLVYARMTGFGQTGPYAKMAGHDINYVASSGVLSSLGKSGSPPTPPINYLGDFAGGGMMCAMGVLLALLERNESGVGQVVDAAMVDGAAYVASFVYNFTLGGSDWFKDDRGNNLLDGGAPYYTTYETKDGRYVSVGALEPQFYAALLKGLGLELSEYPQRPSAFARTRAAFESTFKSKTLQEWSAIFDGTDACVTPVAGMEELAGPPEDASAPGAGHARYRRVLIPREGTDGRSASDYEPAPAPRLSRTPGTQVAGKRPKNGEHGLEVLREWLEMDDEKVRQLGAGGGVFL
ncbi:alpha-methylacyl-CoA racemase [Gonapodya prolifera JEL478]|uniref:Alpha-methylacyl-CoA racemase n=1 Tax=Gonapodya prolifera (strain JEL478) TaxID=1344416 RepID=A0A139B0A8_GONPJ|nr:alpha-methylacyl-CoA racemase [Gonapodya prolifera JEL478]|eukprot:KXS22432.1 alpha-methylacyl-CoA racemase [Gonapodya prolifera JEL478]